MLDFLKRHRFEIQYPDAANILFIGCCMILGGAAGGFDWKYLVYVTVGMLQIYWAARRISVRRVGGVALYVYAAIILIIGFCVLQLLPLGLSNDHGAGDGRLDVFKYFGTESKIIPISFSPIDTLYVITLMIPMFSFFVNIVHSNKSQIDIVIKAFIAIISMSAGIGIIQYATAGNVFQFYDVSHKNSLVGFFSNKNHMGLALACLSVFIYCKLARHKEAYQSHVALAMFAAVFIVLSIGTNSRAGFALNLISIGFIYVKGFGFPRRRFVLASFVIVSLIIFLASYLPVFNDLALRIASSSSDVRFSYLSDAFDIFEENWKFGVGVGAFYYAYLTYEPLVSLSPVYLNNLHNDWFQILIEFGVFGFIIEIAFISLLIIFLKNYRVFQAKGGATDLRSEDYFAWVGIVVTILFCLHSVVDYPIRRPAAAVIFAFGFGLIVREMTGWHRKAR